MLEVKDLWKSYEGKPLLRGVTFEAGQGETICLLGPSGSGKSTILRIIAGLEEAESGTVRWNGADISGVPVYERNFGLMFQDYALFPHRTVAENVAFGLRMQGLGKAEIEKRTQEALERVNLGSFGRRRVTELSGGEQQRVALARALAPRPRLLMLDEPLGALDRNLREQLIEELRQILHETQIPSIYVTHDQEEAFAIADRLVLLHEGQVVQAGTPAQVFARPASEWVARFFGLGNVLPARVINSSPLEVETRLGKFRPSLPCAGSPGGIPAGQEINLLLRPAGARLASAERTGFNQIEGIVRDVVFRGEGFRVDLISVNGHEVDTELCFFLDTPPQPGQRILLSLPPEAVVCMA